MAFFYRPLHEIIDVQNNRNLTRTQKLNELSEYYSTLLAFKEGRVPLNLRNNMMNNSIHEHNIDLFLRVVRSQYSLYLSNLQTNENQALTYPHEIRGDQFSTIEPHQLTAFINEEAHLLSLLGEPRSAVMDNARSMQKKLSIPQSVSPIANNPFSHFAPESEPVPIPPPFRVNSL
jgi:hypothetical protein